MARPSFLVHAPRTTHEDLDNHVDEDDLTTIHQFEEAWNEFLIQNPAVLPTGPKGKRIASIEQQLDALKASKNNVEAEMQRQLEFFDQSKDQLEANFEKAMTSAATTQQHLYADLNRHADNIAVASHDLTLTLPWEYFFHALDNLVVRDEVKPLPEHLSPKSKSMKPSARAIFLVNANQLADSRSQDFILKAYRIDHALLSAQVKMTHREVERYEKTTESLEFLGKFLTDHNIWGLLSKAQSSGSITHVS